MSGIGLSSAIASWFTGSHLADVVLAATALEFLALAGWRARTGHGLSSGTLLRMLLPGVFLTLAVRLALVGGAVPWLALCLLAAGLFHALDVAMRWRLAPFPAGGRGLR